MIRTIHLSLLAWLVAGSLAAFGAAQDDAEKRLACAEGRQRLMRAAEIHRQEGNERELPMVLNNLGILHSRQEQPREALQHYRASLAIKNGSAIAGGSPTPTRASAGRIASSAAEGPATTAEGPATTAEGSATTAEGPAAAAAQPTAPLSLASAQNRL